MVLSVTTEAQRRLVGIVEKFLIANQSTHQAYVNMIEGTNGLGLFARKPNNGELEFARAKNVELDVMKNALMPEGIARELVGNSMSSVFLNLLRGKQGIAYFVRYYEHYMAGSVATQWILS